MLKKLLAAVAALGFLSAPAYAAGVLPPSNPAPTPWAASPCDRTGTATPNDSSSCLSTSVAQINTARAKEGVGPMYLPSNFLSLTGAEQIFVATNLERVDRGLPALTGITDPFDQLAAQGAGHGQDPPFPSGHQWAGAIWAGGYGSTLEADYAWMYDDGPGSANADCTSSNTSGCWGHRDIILANHGTMDGGAATGLGSWGTEYAMLFVAPGGSPSYVYTWSQAVAAGAGKPGPAPSGGSPSSSPPPASPSPPAATRPAGWPVPTRIAGSDRVGTAIAVSQATWADRGGSGPQAGGAVIARDDQFPDALASVPLAASAPGPILLTPSSGLDGRDATELGRIVAPGSVVYLVGGGYALSDAVFQAVAAAGFTPVRVAGADRYATAVAIADALGDPSTVLEVDGNNFPDALAAGPAAAITHSAVLLTDGDQLPGSTAAYRATTAWAIGGPAAAANPSAMPIVGADRFATAAMVADKFVPSPAMIGTATGVAFPDALAAGAQVAQAGGALILVGADSVPSATTAYINAHSSVPMLLYGGVNAVSAFVESIL